LVVNRVDDYFAEVQSVAEAFEEAVGTSTSVNMYAGWRTDNGFDLHWDPQDVTILQVSGRKRWVVYEPTRNHPYRDEPVKPEKPEGQPVWDGILEDGEALHIPRGWWHVAYPLNEPSLHLTVTSVPADGRDLLNWVVRKLTSAETVRKNVPYFDSMDSRGEYISSIRRMVDECLAREDVIEQFWDQWTGSIPVRSNVCLPQAPIEYSAPVSLDSRVRLANARGVVIEDSSGAEAHFSIGGVRGSCPRDILPALRRLRGADSFTVRELAVGLHGPMGETRLLIVLTALSMKGAIWIEPSS